jgi:Fic family protein
MASRRSLWIRSSKKHRRLYYDRFNGTRGSEGCTEWLDFFLQGVRDTANQEARTADSIDKLFRKDKEEIELFGRGSASALLVYRYAQANPLFSIKNAAREMNVSFPTASSAVARMVHADILRESSGKRRDRLFLYESYLDVLNRES